MRINDIYSPEGEASAFAFTISFHNPFNATAVDVCVPDASCQVRSVAGRISVLIATLATDTDELQALVRNAVLICDGIQYKGHELNPVLSGGLVEVPSGFNGCRYHALHQTYPDFFMA